MKTNIVKKLTAGVMAAVLGVTILAVPVSAENLTDYFTSSTATAGTWKQEKTKHLKSSQKEVYGGDVGIWFFVPNVGLEASFARSTDRIAYMECWEEDALNDDDLARKYEARFAETYGYYCPTYFSDTCTNTSCIETNSGLELYMKFKISTDSRDTSKYVKAGILLYQFWAY